MHPLNKPSDELNTQSQIDDNKHDIILLENGPDAEQSSGPVIEPADIEHDAIEHAAISLNKLDTGTMLNTVPNKPEQIDLTDDSHATDFNNQTDGTQMP